MVLKTFRLLPHDLASSYLSLTTNRLQDEQGADFFDADLRSHFAHQLSVEEVASLHGWSVPTEGREGPIVSMTEIFEEIAERYEDGGGSKTFSTNNRTWGEQDREAKVEIRHPETSAEMMKLLEGGEAAFQPIEGGLVIRARSGSHWYWDLRQLSEPGGRFEHLVTKALREALKAHPSVGPTARNLYFARNRKILHESETFETDILFLYGYQLILASCASASQPKTDAFEALHRVRQLGGAGARAIVVGRKIADDVADSVQESIHLEIGLSRNDRSLVIWGKSKCNALVGEFDRYLHELTTDTQ
jgi:hypothetical protein